MSPSQVPAWVIRKQQYLFTAVNRGGGLGERERSERVDENIFSCSAKETVQRLIAGTFIIELLGSSFPSACMSPGCGLNLGAPGSLSLSWLCFCCFSAALSHSPNPSSHVEENMNNP